MPIISIGQSESRTGFRNGTLLEFLDELTPEALIDFNSFIKVANNLKQLAKSCSPSLVREAAKLEKFKRAAIETIRRDWLKRKVISDNAARKAINYIHRIYNEAINNAELQLEFCLRD